jgi:uncharacterized protein (TIGR02246 family)
LTKTRGLTTQLALAGLLQLLNTAGAFAADASKSNEQSVRDFVSAANLRKIDTMMNMVTDDVQWLSVVGDKISVETQGKASLRESLTAYFSSTPSARSELEWVSASASRVAALERAGWQGKAGPKSQTSLSVYEFTGALIARVYYYPVETRAPEGAVAESRREDVAAILQKVEDAWNKHDMQAFANLFHEDGVWVLWTGRVWTGRKAIEEGHVEVHRTIFRNSVQRERLEELTFIGPDAAVVRYCSTLTGDERSPDKIVRSRKILVVTRRDGVWKIGWGQNTRFADSTPDSPGCPASP